MTMNWSEFLRTLTWIFAVLLVLAAILSVAHGSITISDTYSDAKDRRNGRRASIVGIVAIVLAALLFAIIGGMGWGLT